MFPGKTEIPAVIQRGPFVEALRWEYAESPPIWNLFITPIQIETGYLNWMCEWENNLT